MKKFPLNQLSVGMPAQQTFHTHGINLVRAIDTPPVQIIWLWKGYLAKGKFHLLAGAPATGKTTVAMGLVATHSNGGPGGCSWPDNSPNPGGDALIYTGEDGIADTIVTRLFAAGANMAHVHIIHGTFEHGRSRAFDFQKDIARLNDELDKNDRISLIVIDSIVQAVAGDSNKNSDVRKALAPLIDMAERHNCAILGITHVNKGSKGKDPLDRVTGSLAYGAAARVVLFATRVASDLHNGEPQRCVLVRAKSNIGPDDGGFEYHIPSVSFQYGGQTFQSSKVEWGETHLQGPAKEIVKQAESGGEFGNSNAVEAAQQFLGAVLANGGLPFPEIESLARAQNPQISMAALKRAKAEMRIDSRKQIGAGQASPHIWSLPKPQDIRMNPANTQYPAAAQANSARAMPDALVIRKNWEQVLESPEPVQSQIPIAPPITATSIIGEHWPISEEDFAPDDIDPSMDAADRSFDGPNGQLFLDQCIREVRRNLADAANDVDLDPDINREEYAISQAISQVFVHGVTSVDKQSFWDALQRIDWGKEMGGGAH